jgi:hypothetical protein
VLTRTWSIAILPSEVSDQVFVNTLRTVPPCDRVVSKTSVSPSQYVLDIESPVRRSLPSSLVTTGAILVLTDEFVFDRTVTNVVNVVASCWIVISGTRSGLFGAPGIGVPSDTTQVPVKSGFWWVHATLRIDTEESHSPNRMLFIDCLPPRIHDESSWRHCSASSYLRTGK